jgi:hypothetical protein
MRGSIKKTKNKSSNKKKMEPTYKPITLKTNGGKTCQTSNKVHPNPHPKNLSALNFFKNNIHPKTLFTIFLLKNQRGASASQIPVSHISLK